jgi:hypothetical protein
MDRNAIIRAGQVNVLMFTIIALLNAVLAYCFPEVGFGFGALGGASVAAICFQAANTRTFLLVADLIERLAALNEKPE